LPESGGPAVSHAEYASLCLPETRLAVGELRKSLRADGCCSATSNVLTEGTLFFCFPGLAFISFKFVSFFGQLTIYFIPLSFHVFSLFLLTFFLPFIFLFTLLSFFLFLFSLLYISLLSFLLFHCFFFLSSFIFSFLSL
jgi:hypothetical protein